jgi:hypothetical protein
VECFHVADYLDTPGLDLSRNSCCCFTCALDVRLNDSICRFFLYRSQPKGKHSGHSESSICRIGLSRHYDRVTASFLNIALLRTESSLVNSNRQRMLSSSNPFRRLKQRRSQAADTCASRRYGTRPATSPGYGKTSARGVSLALR